MTAVQYRGNGFTDTFTISDSIAGQQGKNAKKAADAKEKAGCPPAYCCRCRKSSANSSTPVQYRLPERPPIRRNLTREKNRHAVRGVAVNHRNGPAANSNWPISDEKGHVHREKRSGSAHPQERRGWPENGGAVPANNGSPDPGEKIETNQAGTQTNEDQTHGPPPALREARFPYSGGIPPPENLRLVQFLEILTVQTDTKLSHSPPAPGRPFTVHIVNGSGLFNQGGQQGKAIKDKVWRVSNSASTGGH
jgi:hypothetical protein